MVVFQLPIHTKVPRTYNNQLYNHALFLITFPDIIKIYLQVPYILKNHKNYYLRYLTPELP